MSKAALTYRDYEALPADGRRYEIHDGELSVTPSRSLDHQIILANLLRVLFPHVPSVAPGLLLAAPLDVILADTADETTIVQPDILYVAPDRMALTSRRGIEGGPRSPSRFSPRPRARSTGSRSAPSMRAMTCRTCGSSIPTPGPSRRSRSKAVATSSS